MWSLEVEGTWAQSVEIFSVESTDQLLSDSLSQPGNAAKHPGCSPSRWASCCCHSSEIVLNRPLPAQEHLLPPIPSNESRSLYSSRVLSSTDLTSLKNILAIVRVLSHLLLFMALPLRGWPSSADTRRLNGGYGYGSSHTTPQWASGLKLQVFMDLWSSWRSWVSKCLAFAINRSFVNYAVRFLSVLPVLFYCTLLAI
jgi:hypothetical protein